MRAPCHLEQRYRCILGVKVANACHLVLRNSLSRPTSRSRPQDVLPRVRGAGLRYILSMMKNRTGRCTRVAPDKQGSRSRVTSRGRLRTCRHHRRTRVREEFNPHLTRGMSDRSNRRLPSLAITLPVIISIFQPRSLNSTQFHEAGFFGL